MTAQTQISIRFQRAIINFCLNLIFLNRLLRHINCINKYYQHLQKCYIYVRFSVNSCVFFSFSFSKFYLS